MMPPVVMFFGGTDYREFVAGLSVMVRGSMDERIEMAFKAYDTDGSGTIDRHEFEKLFVAVSKNVKFSNHQNVKQYVILTLPYPGHPLSLCCVPP
jgi:hypothetical protein